MISLGRRARRGISVTPTGTARGTTPELEVAAAAPITGGTTIASKRAPPEAAATGIRPGSMVITGIGEANVREGPSLDAAIIGTIPLGAEPVVIGPSVSGMM